MNGCPEISSRAAGYGMRAWSADGNDVSEVHAVVTEAVAAARAGEGPGLVEVFTYRMRGHGAHDAQKYVPLKCKLKGPLAGLL